jgi:hypothetical protein
MDDNTTTTLAATSLVDVNGTTTVTATATTTAATTATLFDLQKYTNFTTAPDGRVYVTEAVLVDIVVATLLCALISL